MIKICKREGCLNSTKTAKALYCSYKCRGLDQQKKEDRICKGCRGIFTVTPYEKKIFCSRKCAFPFRTGRPASDPLIRFYSRVDKNGPIPEHCPHLGNCWIFLKSDGGVFTGNYRATFHFRGSEEIVYRVSWMIHKGDIPPDMCICHKCDNPHCVRPDHLFVGTLADNVQDKIKKGRLRVAQGDSHYRAKTTVEQVKEIRKRRLHGHKREDVMKDFKINEGSFITIWYGYSWKHVKPPYD